MRKHSAVVLRAELLPQVSRGIPAFVSHNHPGDQSDDHNHRGSDYYQLRIL
jgi:hypothetical protein